MQPTESSRSSLHSLLNEVFLTKGHVRLLRALVAHPRDAVHPSEAAALAGMSESSARKILNRLSRTGLVERTPNGRASRFSLSRSDSLAKEIVQLFLVERRRGDLLVRAVHEVVQRLSLSPELCWIQDLIAGWADSFEVAVWREEPGPEHWRDELEAALQEVGKRFEVVLKVRAYTEAEIESVDWERAVVVRGGEAGLAGEEFLPEEELELIAADSAVGYLNPASQEFNAGLVALLEENLSVLKRARNHVRARLDEGANGTSPDLWEWQKILDTFSIPRLLHLLASESPRAARLRKCSPFPAVLSEEERTRLSELAGRSK